MFENVKGTTQTQRDIGRAGRMRECGEISRVYRGIKLEHFSNIIGTPKGRFAGYNQIPVTIEFLPVLGV